MKFIKMFLLYLMMILLFTSCNDDKVIVEYVLSRNGDLLIETTSNIRKKYGLHSSFFSENNTTYRIGFPMKLTNIKIKGDPGRDYKQFLIIVDLCKNKKVLNKGNYDYLQKPARMIDNNYTVYFSLKEMIEKNLITIDSSMQKDVCMYVNSKIRTSYFKVEIESSE